MNVKQAVYHLNYINSWTFLFVICYFCDKSFKFVVIDPGYFVFYSSCNSTLYSLSLLYGLAGIEPFL